MKGPIMAEAAVNVGTKSERGWSQRLDCSSEAPDGRDAHHTPDLWSDQRSQVSRVAATRAARVPVAMAARVSAISPRT
jgi:hypothetical protein